MIELKIGIKNEVVYDSFKKEKTNLKEVGTILLRLKQIEHQLINLEFENDIEVDEVDEEDKNGT